MKLIKEDTNLNQIRKKNKKLKESVEFIDDFILNEINECLDNYEIFSQYLWEYIDDRIKVVINNTKDMAVRDRSDTIGKHLVRTLNALEDIGFNTCQFIDTKILEGNIMDRLESKS